MSDEAEKPKSYVLVQFQEIGSVVFTMQVNDVTPMQLLALAGYLEVKAKNEIVQMENARVQEQQIAKPEPKLMVPKGRF